MAGWRTLLVADDFSESSAPALRTAIELAKVFGSRIHLLHVYQRPMEILSPYEVALPESVVAEVLRAARQRLEQSLAEVRAAGVEGELQLREGAPAPTIVAEAEELRADLIVLGTRGLTGLRHLVLGSVAERTLRTAPCPVLTVKSPTAGSTA